MRALVVTQNITVDGSIEMLGDWFDPQGQGDQSDLLEELHRQDRRSDAFLTGRQTFEDLRGVLATAAGRHQRHHRVLERGPQVRGVLDPDDPAVAEHHHPLRRSRPAGTGVEGAARTDIVVTGSITLCHTLIRPGWWMSIGCLSTPSYRAEAAGCFPMVSSFRD